MTIALHNLIRKKLQERHNSRAFSIRDNKTTQYWAERAVITESGFTPVELRGDKGFINGSLVCPNNASDMEKKRLDEHVNLSNSHQDKLPIWC